MTFAEMQARLLEISEDIFHGRTDQGHAEDLKMMANEIGKRSYKTKGDYIEGLVAQLEQAVFEFHTKGVPYTRITDARSLVLFEAHQRLQDVQFFKEKVMKAELKGVAKGREEMKQVLLTLQASTAPDAPWADRAVHEFVTAALKAKKAEKSPFLIDILKDEKT